MVSDYDDSLAMQAGSYRFQPKDLPLLEAKVTAGGFACCHHYPNTDLTSDSSSLIQS
jgi:hypothetical protein